MELWVKIEGYDCYYVSNNGNVKSIERTVSGRLYPEKILKPRVNGKGYLRVHLSKSGITKDYYIHRLVCEYFNDNPFSNKEVNHIDGVKSNNSSDNLEWCTRAENIIHAFENGLNRSPRVMLGKSGKDHNRSKAVLQYSINGDFIKSFGSMSEAIRETGVKGISNCCLGKYKQSGGFIWRYE